MIVSQKSGYNDAFMAKFDLTKTQEVHELFQVPRAKRDSAWTERFYGVIVDASMATTPKQVLRGPDAFLYFVLNLPPVGEPFETFCVSHVLDVCLKNGFGIVINPDPEPQWVFTYGNLWSLQAFGKFEVEPCAGHETVPTDNGEAAPSKLRRSVFVGQPSPSFLPPYARLAVKNFLAARLPDHNIGIVLVHDPTKEPPQGLVFSLFPEDFPSEKDFQLIMYRLTWFFPRHYRVASVGKNNELAKQFEPL